MRIVVITTSFPRSDEDPSGHFVRSSARALCRAGHEVHVIAPGGSLLEGPQRHGELYVHRAGGGALFAWPGAVARAREAPWRVLAAGPFGAGVLRRLHEIGQVDRVVAHWIVPCAWPLAAFTRAPLDVVAHGTDVRVLVASPRPLRERILGSLLEREARFTFAARASLDALAKALSPHKARALRKASHVDPPSIDVPEVDARAAELRTSLELAPGERLAVVACRLIPSKRVDLAIDAAAAVHTGGAGPRLRMIVIGDGPERASLEKHAAAVGPSVRLLGALPRRDTLAWIAAADVLLHASAIEAAPTVVREARALGVRVIACDTGDVTAWAKDDPGITVAEPNAARIAALLVAPAAPAAPGPDHGHVERG
jgi:glycosyltransferase involved in cell wall biosynthesis